MITPNSNKVFKIAKVLPKFTILLFYYYQISFGFLCLLLALILMVVFVGVGSVLWRDADQPAVGVNGCPLRSQATLRTAGRARSGRERGHRSRNEGELLINSRTFLCLRHFNVISVFFSELTSSQDHDVVDQCTTKPGCEYEFNRRNEFYQNLATTFRKTTLKQIRQGLNIFSFFYWKKSYKKVCFCTCRTKQVQKNST